MPTPPYTPSPQPTHLDVTVGYVDRHGCWHNARVTFSRGGCTIATAEYSEPREPGATGELHSTTGTPPMPWASVEARVTYALQAAAALRNRKHRTGRRAA